MMPTGKTGPSPSETPPVPCGAGDVVLELGDNIGAAVIYTGPELDGGELEIPPGRRSVDRYPRCRPGAPVAKRS